MRCAGIGPRPCSQSNGAQTCYRDVERYLGRWSRDRVEVFVLEPVLLDVQVLVLATKRTMKLVNVLEEFDASGGQFCNAGGVCPSFADHGRAQACPLKALMDVPASAPLKSGPNLTRRQVALAAAICVNCQDGKIHLTKQTMQRIAHYS